MSQPVPMVFILGNTFDPYQRKFKTSEGTNLSLIGPPGAGKSTLGSLLANDFSMRHISIGDLLRRLKEDVVLPDAQSLSQKLERQELIDGHTLVPIIYRELERLELQDLERKAVILDGFPRSWAQRRVFEVTVPALVLIFHCPKEVAKQRYLSRKLKGREADNEVLFERRYKEYVEENEALVRDYRQRGLLIEIDTGRSLAETQDSLYNMLKNDIRWANLTQQ